MINKKIEIEVNILPEWSLTEDLELTGRGGETGKPSYKVGLDQDKNQAIIVEGIRYTVATLDIIEACLKDYEKETREICRQSNRIEEVRKKLTLLKFADWKEAYSWTIDNVQPEDFSFVKEFVSMRIKNP